MNNVADRPVHLEAPTLAGDLTQAFLRLVWQMVRLPIFLLLVVLEPVVDVVFGALALLGILMAIFFKCYGLPVGFPFFTMLAVSVCFGLIPLAYVGVLRLFSK